MRYFINTSNDGTLEVPELGKLNYKGYTIIGRGFLNWNKPIQENFVKLIDQMELAFKKIETVDSAVVNIIETLKGTNLGAGIDFNIIKRSINDLEYKTKDIDSIQYDIGKLKSKLDDIDKLKIVKETKEFEITDDDVNNGYINTIIDGWQDVEVFYNNKRLIEGKQYSFESEEDEDGNEVTHKIVINGLANGDIVTVVKRKVGV